MKNLPPSLLAPLLVAAAMVRAAAAEPTPEQIEFFETKVRPIFAEHCYDCHSEKAVKIKGGLRLDSPGSLLAGGTTGPAFVPGDPDASLLIKAVRYTDPDLQMPPKDKKLADEQIANLTAWVKMGAPLPQSSTSTQRPTDVASVRARHWAFQPIVKPNPPVIKHSGWVRTSVDNFVLAMLQKKQLQPAPAADRRTLIRRVSYDLTGLPPTNQEVEDFIADPRPDAYPRLVDHLLASRHYGERWGRYWLDVARYADTKGYLAGGEERRYAFSYTYRDYVIRAFNDDIPYDQFLIEQIAADRLPLGEDHRALAALGFLTLGRRFLNNQNDIIDDRIDVVTRGTLGLTVACARCHDHKFDPIPTKDYYALHGVFASTEEPAELPLLGALKDSPDYQDFLKQKAKIEAEIPEYKAREVAKFISELRQHVGDYLLGVRDASGLDPAKFETFAGERKINPAVLRRWITDLDARKKKPDVIFGPWFELAGLPEAEFATNSKPLLAKYVADPATANPIVARALAESATNSLRSAADAYTRLFKEVDGEWKAALAEAQKSAAEKTTSSVAIGAEKLHSAAPEPGQPKDQSLFPATATNSLKGKDIPTALPNADREALRQVLYAEGAAVNLPPAEAETILARTLGEGTAPIRNRVEALGWTHPGAPLRAMAVADRANPGNSHVLKRGNPGTPGDEVPRRFVEVLCPSERAAFTNGSGRLELARAIASPSNPLTARVFVNRVWLHHFGEGLVSTPGDFGVRTAEPVHHALLDYLAASFMESGWSTKNLHRLILLSATYQQSCEGHPGSRKVDPDNGLLSRMNRQRLDFEATRDTLLALAGTLDQGLGGLPVDLESQPFSRRRTVYGLIDRQNLPGLFRTFDFANPDTSSQGRFHTTVPQQALFLMNSPFVLEQARALAQRSEIKAAVTNAEKTQALYRLVLQRPAARDEVQLAERFMTAQASAIGPVALSPVEKYAQILLLSNEVMFIE